MNLPTLIASYKAKKASPTAEQVIADLAQCGITLSTDGTHLHTPPGAMSNELAALLAPLEADLIAALFKPAPAKAKPAKAPTDATPEPKKD